MIGVNWGPENAIHSPNPLAPVAERNAITRMFRSLASDPMMQPDAPAAWGEEERDGRVITMDTDGLGANRQGQVLKSTPRAPVNAEPISMDDHFVVDNAPPKPPKREMNGQSEPVEREVAQHVLPNHAHLKTPDNAERPQKVLAGHRKTKVGHWYQHGGAIPGLARKAGNDHVARDHAFPKIERPTSTQHNCKKVQWRQDEPRPATASGPYVAGMRTEFDIFPDWRAPHRQVVPMTQVPYRVRALRQTPATTKHACATFRRRDFVIHPEWITH